MEHYIKGTVNDITYQSELIPPAFLRKQEGGLNSQTQATGKKEAAIIYVAPSELP